MNSDRVKVSSNPNLVKTLGTGTVLNVDQDAYQSALARKKRNKEFLDLKKELHELKQRVSNLEALLKRE